jgi:hypothetical protein
LRIAQQCWRTFDGSIQRGCWPSWRGELEPDAQPRRSSLDSGLGRFDPHSAHSGTLVTQEPPAEVAYVTKDCGAKALLGSPEKVEPALRAGVSGLEAIVFGDEPIEGATPFAALIGDPEGFDPVRADPAALSTIGYTSGTTGHPRARCSPIVRSC